MSLVSSQPHCGWELHKLLSNQVASCHCADKRSAIEWSLLNSRLPFDGRDLLPSLQSKDLSSISTFNARTAHAKEASVRINYMANTDFCKQLAKQMELLYNSLADFRDLKLPGPGARLIPWFLPESERYPNQQQSPKP